MTRVLGNGIILDMENIDNRECRYFEFGSCAREKAVRYPLPRCPQSDIACPHYVQKREYICRFNIPPKAGETVGIEYHYDESAWKYAFNDGAAHNIIVHANGDIFIGGKHVLSPIKKRAKLKIDKDALKISPFGGIV